MNTKQIGNLIELSSDKYIHKIGTETYFKKGIITDSIDNYEEVDEMPKYSKEEYKQKVRELIKERYTIEDEIAILANMNSPMSLSAEEHNAEYLDYQTYREECKIKAKEILSNGNKD